MTRETIGFIGLGRLGLPVATNLLASGQALHVWNRTAAKAEPLVAKGARLVARPSDTVTPGGVLVTLLWDDASVDEILRSPGLLERLVDGLHISMSTLSPDGSRALARLHAAHGSAFVDAPIFGGRDAAVARKLWVPISGAASAKARAKPLIEAMGAQGVYDFGEDVGAATTVKVIGNFLILSAAASLREGLALAGKSGVDPRALLDMMTETLFASSVYINHGKIVVDGSPALRQSAIPAKDLGLFLTTAGAAGASSSLAAFLLDALTVDHQ